MSGYFSVPNTNNAFVTDIPGIVNSPADSQKSALGAESSGVINFLPNDPDTISAQDTTNTVRQSGKIKKIDIWDQRKAIPLTEEARQKLSTVLAKQKLAAKKDPNAAAQYDEEIAEILRNGKGLDLAIAPKDFRRQFYSNALGSPALTQGFTQNLPPDDYKKSEELNLRGFRALHEENPKLVFSQFIRHPDVAHPVPLTDEGMDEDDYINKYGTRPFVDCARDHLSTFGMDVDTAAYTLARAALRGDKLPAPDTVRVEEFVNYFKQPYTVQGNEAFGVFAESAQSPFVDHQRSRSRRLAARRRERAHARTAQDRHQVARSPAPANANPRCSLL